MRCAGGGGVCGGEGESSRFRFWKVGKWKAVLLKTSVCCHHTPPISITLDIYSWIFICQPAHLSHLIRKHQNDSHTSHHHIHNRRSSYPTSTPILVISHPSKSTPRARKPRVHTEGNQRFGTSDPITVAAMFVVQLSREERAAVVHARDDAEW